MTLHCHLHGVSIGRWESGQSSLWQLQSSGGDPFVEKMLYYRMQANVSVGFDAIAR
jgi:hypothetical protein